MNFFGAMFGGQPGVYGGIQRGQNPWQDANFLGNIEQAQREGAGYSGPTLAGPGGFTGKPIGPQVNGGPRDAFGAKSTRQVNPGLPGFGSNGPDPSQMPMGDRMQLNLDPSLLGNPTVTPNQSFGQRFAASFGQGMQQGQGQAPQAPELPAPPMMGRNGRNLIAELLQSIGGGGNYLGRLGSL